MSVLVKEHGGFSLLCLWISLSALNSYAGERLPYEYFAKSTDYHDVQISPDGKTYGIRFAQKGNQVLAFIDRKKMKITGGAKPLRDGNVSSFQWVNEERVTYRVSIPDSYLDAPLSTGDLYAVNRSGAKHEVIYGINAGKAGTGGLIGQRESTSAAFRIIDTLPDEKDWILMAEYPYKQVGRIWTTNSRAPTTIVKLNVYNGRKRNQGGATHSRCRCDHRQSA